MDWKKEEETRFLTVKRHAPQFEVTINRNTIERFKIEAWNEEEAVEIAMSGDFEPQDYESFEWHNADKIDRKKEKVTCN